MEYHTGILGADVHVHSLAQLHVHTMDVRGVGCLNVIDEGGFGGDSFALALPVLGASRHWTS